MALPLSEDDAYSWRCLNAEQASTFTTTTIISIPASTIPSSVEVPSPALKPSAALNPSPPTTSAPPIDLSVRTKPDAKLLATSCRMTKRIIDGEKADDLLLGGIGISCAEAIRIHRAYDAAPDKQGSAGGADLQNGWFCESTSGSTFFATGYGGDCFGPENRFILAWKATTFAKGAYTDINCESVTKKLLATGGGLSLRALVKKYKRDAVRLEFVTNHGVLVARIETGPFSGYSVKVAGSRASPLGDREYRQLVNDSPDTKIYGVAFLSVTENKCDQMPLDWEGE